MDTLGFFWGGGGGCSNLSEQCSKPSLFAVYIGLYYPIIWEIVTSRYKDPYHPTSIISSQGFEQIMSPPQPPGLFHVLRNLTESVGFGKVEKTDSNKNRVGQHLGAK